jgi:hypothetical protein
MRTLTIALIVAAGAIGTASSAAASATVTNISVAGQNSIEPGSPTCAGGTATNTFTFNTGHLHQTIRPDGTEHDTLTVEGSFLQVPDDPSQPTYTGHFAFWDGDNFNKNVQISPHFTTNIDATGSDGSVIHIHWTFMVQTQDGEAHILNSTFTCH